MKKQTIIYMGMELPLFHSETPQTFGNEGKLMAVSNDGGPCIQKEVLAYVPFRDFPVITKDLEYRYCAELPDIQEQVNSYVTCKNSMLVRGMVSTVVCNAACGKTEVLCKNAVDAYKEGNSVLYISIASPSNHVFDRCMKLAGGHCGNLSVVQGSVNMNTCRVESLFEQYVATQGVTPDILIIDDISLLSAKTCCFRSERKKVYSELVNLARGNNIAIITAEFVSSVY